MMPDAPDHETSEYKNQIHIIREIEYNRLRLGQCYTEAEAAFRKKEIERLEVLVTGLK